MRLIDFRKLLMVFALVLGMAVVSSPSADAKALSLVNNTGADIVVMNCSPSSSGSWYEDVLGNSTWPAGTTITLDFDSWAMADTWDFKVHYANGASEDWYGVNVRTVNTIILKPNGVNEYL